MYVAWCVCGMMCYDGWQCGCGVLVLQVLYSLFHVDWDKAREEDNWGCVNKLQMFLASYVLCYLLTSLVVLCLEHHTYPS